MKSTSLDLERELASMDQSTAAQSSTPPPFELVELNEGVCREAIQLRQKHRLRLPDALIWACARATEPNL